MSEYLSKKAVLEWFGLMHLEYSHNAAVSEFIESGIEIFESGAFDADESEQAGTKLADEQGYHEWVLGGLINATNEIQRLRSVFSSRGVFNALRYYQKQGLCEGNEYEEIEYALEALSAKTSTGEQRSMEPVGKMKIFNRDGSVTEVTPNRLWTPEGDENA